MASKSYKIVDGTQIARFHESRAKVRLIAGGFANGKTTAAVAETLRIAKDYPGATGLLARATYPKLNSTLRREFVKWCPVPWIKTFDKSKENTCVLQNGTTIDFRYIDQKVNADGEGTSNLLSANYDFIVVDQIDDVEITLDDFLQLLGRLRGAAQYEGEDDTMPLTGPRMIVLTCNPTLGWPYEHLVKPVHDLRNGIFNSKLVCIRDPETNEPVLDDNGQPQPLIDVFEAPTYENAQNLEPDYLRLLEATYTGKMRDRYILGKWVAFEGVVYDEFDSNLHVVPHNQLMEYIQHLRMQGFALTLTEGYDFGQTSPSVYLLSLGDNDGRVFIVDGFYEPNELVEDQAQTITELRNEHALDALTYNPAHAVLADPSIFKGTHAQRGVVGKSVARMFQELNIRMAPGNNNILNGIVKVKTMLRPQLSVVNPFTGALGCPKLFVSSKLHWFATEMNTWRWKKNTSDVTVDKTVDTNNHALDALRYMLSKVVPSAPLIRTQRVRVPRRWTEQDSATTTADTRRHRYAA